MTKFNFQAENVNSGSIIPEKKYGKKAEMGAVSMNFIFANAHSEEQVASFLVILIGQEAEPAVNRNWIALNPRRRHVPSILRWSLQYALESNRLDSEKQ